MHMWLSFVFHMAQYISLSAISFEKQDEPVQEVAGRTHQYIPHLRDDTRKTKAPNELKLAKNVKNNKKDSPFLAMSKGTQLYAKLVAWRRCRSSS